MFSEHIILIKFPNLETSDSLDKLQIKMKIFRDTSKKELELTGKQRTGHSAYIIKRDYSTLSQQPGF